MNTFDSNAARPLGSDFFARPTEVVARELLGKVLVSTVAGAVCGGVIVETEAYLGAHDPGSHASTKGITERNRVMYGPPGCLYVYFTYGNHHMVNLVTEREGTAGAVLIRALEPVVGIDPMSARRGGRTGVQVANGPGKVAEALGIGLEQNGQRLGGPVVVYDAECAVQVAQSGRVGLTSGHELPLRFYVAGSEYVSKGRTGQKPPTRRGRVREGTTMRLKDIYRTAIDAGIEADGRSREEIDQVLAASKKEHEALDADEKRFFDTERLTNPYDDTRIAFGDPELEVRGLITGIDMEASEVLLADRLREKGEPIDLILAHHPEGPGYANLHRVMHMQADLWAARGVGLGLADALIGPRAEEIQRRILPVNHYRAIDAARLLGLATMSCHTPADNSVNRFVQELIDAEAPRTLDDLVKLLRSVPEYEDAALKGYGPILVQGSGSKRCGSVLVDMTGGTEGPKEALDRLSQAGVDTLVGMHYSEEHKKHAEELKLNLVIAGHVSSDTLGMNLILDRIEPQAVKVICTSGMVRVRRS